MAIPAEQLRSLQARSDARGLARLAGHLAAIAGTGAVYGVALQRSAPVVVVAAAAVGFGFTLVTMFAAMHESVHRTAFRSLWLNNAVGWLAGLLSFYNSTFYRHYHGWHHRFTQIPGKDPELEDPKPTSIPAYLLELSGLPWWLGKLRTHGRIALGRLGGYGFLNAQTGPAAVRSVRLQLLVYGLAVALSVALGRPLFLTWWLLPVAVAQPLLRAILLAEHTGCSNDGDGFANTRTTHTVLPVRFLMWNMPFHAEHHLHPSLPFFSLVPAHGRLRPRLVHVAERGYLRFHLDLLGQLTKGGTT